MKNILVIGAGRFGTYLMREFAAQGDDILVIDSQEERLQKALPYVTSSLIGNATDPDFMKTIGVDSFDLCVVSIGDDFSLEVRFDGSDKSEFLKSGEVSVRGLCGYT